MLICSTLCHVQKDGKTLMLHRNKKGGQIHDDKWNGLGGKMEAGETPEECVIREVKEAYFDYQKSRIQVESSLKRNQYRYRLAELSKIRLAKAEIEISEFLQAQNDLAEERKKLHGALTDLYKAKSKLNRSIGIRDFLPMEDKYAL